jgi:hypothetical protein
VRLVNAVPSRQRIDVAADGRRLFTDVGYRSVTPYATVAGHGVTFRMQATGTEGALTNNRAMMTDGNRYTLVALPLDYENVRLRVVRDEVAADLDKARIRIFNAAPAVRHAAVVIRGQNAAMFPDVAYAAVATFRDIEPATATVEIRRDTGSGRTLVLRDLRFQPGRTYTIILTGWRTADVETILLDDPATGGSPAVSLKALP